VRAVSRPDATLVVRFGAINDRAIHALDLLDASLDTAGWRTTSIVPAGTARDGRRQADQFARDRSTAIAEHDIWAVLR
jgi:hypothetical protein